MSSDKKGKISKHKIDSVKRNLFGGSVDRIKLAIQVEIMEEKQRKKLETIEVLHVIHSSEQKQVRDLMADPNSGDDNIVNGVPAEENSA